MVARPIAPRDCFEDSIACFIGYLPYTVMHLVWTQTASPIAPRDCFGDSIACFIGYLPYTVMHLVWPQTLAESWFSVSPRYYSRPKRNRKQWRCKFLGGKKVRYGSCENGEFLVFNWSQQNSKKKRTICPPTFLLSWSDVLEQLKTYIRFSLRKGSSLEFL